MIGLPRNPQAWDRPEHRLFCDWLRLEQWRLAVLAEEVFARQGGRPERRDLTAAFETTSDERERRIGVWRERALLAMMAVRRIGESKCYDANKVAGQDAQALVRPCGCLYQLSCKQLRTYSTRSPRLPTFQRPDSPRVPHIRSERT